MILTIDSDLPSFKPIAFQAGLNVILADKSDGASDRQSRNGAGKTSFVELVHFLFGADARKDSIFRSDALIRSTFTIRFKVDGHEVSASRCGEHPSRIQCNSTAPEWPKFAGTESLLDLRLRNEDWKDALGAKWFGLPPKGESERFTPSFRSLFSMFARRQESGGFLRPMQHSERQQLWDQQVTISHLLGLDATIPARFQDLRTRERSAKNLRQTAESGEVGQYFGKASDLRTRLAVTTARTERLRTQIDEFRVVPEYQDREREASELTNRINDLNVENLVDHELLHELNGSLDLEESPAAPDLEKLYREANIVLPDLARKRLEDVRQFHRAIVNNRRNHLTAEIRSAEARIRERNRNKVKLDQRRSQVMEVLDSGGALESYTALREELGRAAGEAETVRSRLELAETLERTQTELDMERHRLTQLLRDDIAEREEAVREAILSFEELSESLYERAGSLSISDTLNGPALEFHIDAERSKGITNMQIFCFDLMLAQICSRRRQWPGFLIHDSHLFDGVDERQVAKALQLGADRAARDGFQYIVTMNSDALPHEGFRSDFRVSDHVIAPHLTDATESGGLFGIRFN